MTAINLVLLRRSFYQLNALVLNQGFVNLILVDACLTEVRNDGLEAGLQISGLDVENWTGQELL